MFITPDKMDGKRISYDYVVKRYKIQQLLKDYKLIALKNICEEITSGIRIKKEYYTDGSGYRVISPGDIQNEVVSLSKLKRIKNEFIKDKDIVNSGDIIITAAGKSGQILFVNDELEGCIITSDIIKIRLKDKSQRLTVYSFLKSKIGKMMLDTVKVGLLNKISVEDISNLLIPKEYKLNVESLCLAI